MRLGLKYQIPGSVAGRVSGPSPGDFVLMTACSEKPRPNMNSSRFHDNFTSIMITIH